MSMAAPWTPGWGLCPVSRLPPPVVPALPQCMMKRDGGKVDGGKMGWSRQKDMMYLEQDRVDLLALSLVSKRLRQASLPPLVRKIDIQSFKSKKNLEKLTFFLKAQQSAGLLSSIRHIRLADHHSPKKDDPEEHDEEITMENDASEEYNEDKDNGKPTQQQPPSGGRIGKSGRTGSRSHSGRPSISFSEAKQLLPAPALTALELHNSSLDLTSRDAADFPDLDGTMVNDPNFFRIFEPALDQAEALPPRRLSLSMTQTLISSWSTRTKLSTFSGVTPVSSICDSWSRHSHVRGIMLDQDSDWVVTQPCAPRVLLGPLSVLHAEKGKHAESALEHQAPLRYMDTNSVEDESDAAAHLRIQHGPCLTVEALRLDLTMSNSPHRGQVDIQTRCPSPSSLMWPRCRATSQGPDAPGTCQDPDARRGFSGGLQSLLRSIALANGTQQLRLLRLRHHNASKLPVDGNGLIMDLCVEIPCRLEYLSWGVLSGRAPFRIFRVLRSPPPIGAVPQPIRLQLLSGPIPNAALPNTDNWRPLLHGRKAGPFEL
ncbi:hypothetical protein V8E36_002204 [Tilletia maclaganii]